MRSKRDILFYRLPCVYFNKEYFLFSPYIKKTIVLSDLTDKERIKLEIEKRYGKRFFGKPILKKRDETFQKITLITTTDCNLACRYCSVRAGEKKDFMPILFAKKAVEEGIKPKTRKIKIIFFGGEPTLHFRCIEEIVNYVKRIRIPHEFVISTNGVIPNKIIDFLCDNNFTIQISADGIPDIQDYQRPLPKNMPTSKILEKTINKLVNKNARFKIRETVTNLNVDKMAESVSYYAKLGVDYVFFEPLIMAGRAIGNKRIKCPNPKKFLVEFERALNRAEKEGIQIGNSLLINLLHPSTHYCGAALGETFAMTPTGIVTACTAIQDSCNALSKIMVIGRYNLSKNEFEYNRNRIQHLCQHNVENIKKCSNCFAKYICSGGCIIRNLVKSGVLEKTNEEYCKIRRGLLRLIILKMSGVSRISSKLL